MTERLQKFAPLVAIGLVGAGHALAWQPERAGSLSFVAFAALPTLSLALLGAWWLRYEDGDFRMLVPRFGDPSRGIVTALLLFGCAWLFTRVVAAPGTPREAWIARLYLHFGPTEPLRAHMMAVVFGLLVIAAAEEILWRGAMVRLLEPRFGSRRAWMVAAVCYSLAHLPTAFVLADERAGKNPLLVLGALGAGLVWGALARMVGRLGPAILAHWAFDWTVLMFMRLWGPSP